jgi:hypothetical protein
VEASLVEKIAEEEDGRVVVMMLPCGVAEEQGTVDLLPGTLNYDLKIASRLLVLVTGHHGGRGSDFLQAGRK